MHTIFSGAIGRYVPFHSARVERCAEATEDRSECGQVYQRMIEQLIGGLPPQRLTRFDINYSLEVNIQSVLGRAAHIKSLNSIHLIVPLLHWCRAHFVLSGQHDDCLGK